MHGVDLFGCGAGPLPSYGQLEIVLEPAAAGGSEATIFSTWGQPGIASADIQGLSGIKFVPMS